ncbi:MAG: hypothetical protein BWZ06_00270 [Bacteroidetes bacterium ADurb.BinA261]|nr:MAG: hypothetical protein BWZ06_00270 [Bacteroidetes bacterium ADurb.BinA261]
MHHRFNRKHYYAKSIIAEVKQLKAVRKTKNVQNKVLDVFLWCAVHGTQLGGESPIWEGNRQPLAEDKASAVSSAEWVSAVKQNLLE